MDRYGFWEKLLFPPAYVNEKRLREKLEGKTVLITGASFGIGEKLAYRLADLPVHLILVARTEEKLLAMKREIEGEKTAKVSVFPADLRDMNQMEAFLAFLHQMPGGLDVLVSNAGISIRRSIRESMDRYHDFTRTMAINYFAPVQLLLSAIPLLEKNRGQIVNVSTVNALLLPLPYWAAYQASKSAFDVWFRSAAPELNAMAISTTSIYLPLVKTRMILPTEAYRKMPSMDPDHVARIICRTLVTKRRKYKPWWLLPGQLASVLFGGLWDWALPRRLIKKGKGVERV